MSDLTLTIRSVKCRAVTAPLQRPVRTAVGTIPSAPLVLIDLLTREGITGRAYIFAYNKVALASLAQMVQAIGDELQGKAVTPVDRMAELERQFRLLGWQGLIGMAIAGLDMALWDALSRAAGLPLARLLGGQPRAIPAYDSYGVVERSADEATLARSVASGRLTT